MDSLPNNTTFHQFPLFPPEIRRAIWEFCLPRRVVEIDYPSQYVTNPYRRCGLVTTTATNTKPPLISHLCLEAREVAFEHGGINRSILNDEEGSETESDSEASSMGPPYLHANDPWIQPSVDIIHLNWEPSYNSTCEGWDEEDPIPFFHSVVDRTGPPAISITAEMLLPFYGDWFREAHRNTDMIRKLDSEREYMVALVMVSIYIPLDIAARSGLFGLLGDDRVKLVDPSDWDTIEKYMDLWTDHGSVEDKEAVIFKHLFSDRHAFQARLERWKVDVVKVWVWHCWCHGMQIGGEQPDTDEIWLGSDAWLGAPQLGPVPYHPPPWGIDIDHRQPNDDLPWVRRQKERMPTLHPKIMFRLCGRGCFLPVELRPPLRGRRMDWDQGRFRSRSPSRSRWPPGSGIDGRRGSYLEFYL